MSDAAGDTPTAHPAAAPAIHVTAAVIAHAH
jgi:hypothetical protein